MAHHVQPLAGMGNGDLALAEVGAGQVCPRQVGALQAGAADIGAGHHRVAQVSASETAAEQVGALQPGADHVGAIEDAAGEVGVRQLTPAEVQVGKIGKAQGESAPARPTGDIALMAGEHDLELRLAQPPTSRRRFKHRQCRVRPCALATAKVALKHGRAVNWSVSRTRFPYRGRCAPRPGGCRRGASLRP